MYSHIEIRNVIQCHWNYVEMEKNQPSAYNQHFKRFSQKELGTIFGLPVDWSPQEYSMEPWLHLILSLGMH